MATLNVPGTYPTIAAAVEAAVPGDTILIAAGYAGAETVTVSIDNLTFSAPAGVPGIVLNAAPNVLRVTLADGSPIAVRGNAANNVITGNNGANAIMDGGGGNDTLNGGAGDDTITVTGGTDRVNGGTGANDLLVVDYSAASAAVTGSHGAGSFSDGGTRTVTFSAVERVSVTGGSGNDNLTGGSSNDTLDGGGGSDSISSSGGTDILRGGTGNDSFFIYNGAGTVDGGADTDTVISYDLGEYTFSNVEVLDQQNAYVYASVAQLASFGSFVSAGSASDSQYTFYLRGAGGTLDFTGKVTGAHSVFVIDQGVTSGYSVTGTANGDSLGGSAYNDTLDGGGGSDSISSSGGTDILRGGTGNDSFFIYNGAGTVDGGADTDTVISYDLGEYTFSNVEVLDQQYAYVYASVAQLASFGSYVSAGSASNSRYTYYLRGAGGTLDFTGKVTGAHSVNVTDQGVTSGYSVTGTANGDSLGGSAYNDTLDGGGGNDAIYGSGGTDILRGGTGSDSFFINNGAGTVDGGTDTDTVVSDNLGNFTFSNVEVLDQQYGYVYASVAQLVSFGSYVSSGSGSDGQYTYYLRGAGGTLDFTGKVTGAHSVYVSNQGVTSGYSVTGTANGDYLSGSEFDDVLNGGGGNDTLIATGGRDVLDGGGGNDAIYGGGGTDILRGGTGNDSFFINNGAGTVDGGADADTVVSYDLGEYTFSNVEVLDQQNAYVYASVAQLASFGSFVSAGSASDSQYIYYLRGAGGTLDFTGKVTGAHSVYVSNQGVTSGYSVTGTANGDYLSGSEFDDVLNGGGGNDTLIATGGRDVLDGGAGNDAIYGGGGTDILRGGTGNDSFFIYSGAGTVDGGADTDTVIGSDLGDFTFSNVEVLDQRGSYTYASVAQLASFGSYVGSGSASNSQYGFYLRGAGGTLDFTGKVTGAHSVNVSNQGVTSGYSVTGTANGDYLSGSGFDDVLNGGGGNDTLIGSGGRDVLRGGAGNDYLQGNFDGAAAVYDDATAAVTVSLATTNSQNTGGAGSDRLYGITRLIGSTFNDTLTGDTGNNVLEGGAGNDTLNGGAGDDLLVGSVGNDTLNGGADTDTASYADATAAVTVTLASAAAQDTGGAGTDTLTQVENLVGSAFGDTLSGSTAANMLDGGEGDDLLSGGAGGDRLVGGSGTDTASYATSTAAVVVNLQSGAASGGDALNDQLSGFENLVGSGGDDRLTGDGASNVLTGLAGADTLVGGGGNDTLDGGVGNDVLDGGADNDTASYAAATAGVTVDLAIVGTAQNTFGAGFDRISNVENLFGSGFGDTLAGDGGANRLIGGGGDDRLTGGAGSDVLDGGAGSDTAVVAFAWRDATVSFANDAYSIAANGDVDRLTGIELVQLTNGTFAIADILNDAPVAADDSGAVLVEAGADQAGSGPATGNVFANDADPDAPLGDTLTLTGVRAGAETDGGGLTGVAGATVIAGIYGTLTVNAAGLYSYELDQTDADTQALAAGVAATERFTYTAADVRGLADTAELSFAITGSNDAAVAAALAATKDEDAIYSGQVIAIDPEGDALSYALVGEAPAGVTFNADGSFTVAPLPADQALKPGQSRDVTFSYTASDGTATSAAASVTVTVNGANDAPAAANDRGYVTRGTSYVVPVAALLVNDADPEGDALSIVGVGNAQGGTVALVDGQVVFKAAAGTTTGSGGFDYLLSDGTAQATGRVALDLLAASSGADTLTVGTAAGEYAFLDGLVGNDTLTGGAGIDTLYGSAGNDRLSGESGADRLYGGDSTDILDGGAGDDLMVGGAGNDTYIVDSLGDIVRETTDTGADAGGTDVVAASISYVLGANLENLTLTGSADLSATGNASSNTITGNSGANQITGGGGSDRLAGGLGDDTYLVGNSGVTVTEASNSGNDTVRASVSFVLGANVETLVMLDGANNGTGGATNNTIIGNAGSNVINGGGGADVMLGGLGNDTYYVDTVSDVVTELFDEGTDTVSASVSYVLGANLERLQLTGTGNNSATGNGLANSVTGNAGDNIIVGLGGKDTLAGGLGADTFTFRGLSDSLVASTGRDTVTDFNQSELDRIDLRTLDADTARNGNQAFSFIGTDAFTRSAGQLRYAASGTSTLVSGDVDGDGFADFSLLLQGQITLVAADFLL